MTGRISAFLMTAAVFMSLGVLSCSGNTVTYGTYNYYYDAVHNGYDHTSAGALIPSANNWVVVLYSSGDTSIGAFGDPDDTWLATYTSGQWAGDGSVGPVVFEANENQKRFLRVFNCTDFVNDSNIGSATEYVNLDASEVYTVGAGALQNWPGNGTALDGSDWLPVPEPGTLCLLGVGGLAMAIARRRRQKA